jgi:hypothetical protein
MNRLAFLLFICFSGIVNPGSAYLHKRRPGQKILPVSFIRVVLLATIMVGQVHFP